jgi:anti-sigma factor RsiW
MTPPDFHDDRSLSPLFNSKAHSLEDETRVLDYLDGNLDANQSNAVEEHLATCAECQALSHTWQQLDSELAVAASRLTLSLGFATRMRRRIEAEPPVLAAELTRKRLQLEADLETQWRKYQKGFLRAQVPAFLDLLGYGTACAIGGLLLFLLTLGLIQGTNGAATETLQRLVAPLVAGLMAILLFISLGWGRRTPFYRELEF